VSWVQVPVRGVFSDTKPSTKKKMQKPYIKLDQNFPGIVSLFMYDQENAKNLSAMAETILRRERSGLSIGFRELIAAFVSECNECQFCYRSHAACAKEYLGQELVDEVCERMNAEALPPKYQALLALAAAVTFLKRDDIATVVEHCKELQASDEEIHDTVLVAAFFNMCNRYVDGLGTTFKANEPEEGGKSLKKYGYIFGVRRFVGEVLPKMWAQLWT
jgi:uncharacterized peroxidase-related enzyme